MNLHRKVGQLLMIGFEGEELSQEFITWLKEYQPGGVILFSRNLVSPAQIAELTNSIQAQAPDAPFLIGIDQEGGRVSRLPQGFTIFPPAATVGACHSPDLAYQAAAVTAQELRAVGINMNMAPVLDVNSNPSNPIIGNRAFADDPNEVCTMGEATLSGLHDHGVLACGKHFPGHGDTTADSHKELPIVNVSKADLERRELKPFRHAISRGLRAIMSGHVRYPALDDTAPATLSHKVMTVLLRQDLGFTGLSLSDDLEMHAIVDHLSVGDAAVQSLQAGVDLLLICQRLDRQIEAVASIQRALASGELSPASIELSLARLFEIKQRFLFSSQSVDPRKIPQLVGRPSHLEVLRKIQRLSAST